MTPLQVALLSWVSVGAPVTLFASGPCPHSSSSLAPHWLTHPHSRRVEEPLSWVNPLSALALRPRALSPACLPPGPFLLCPVYLLGACLCFFLRSSLAVPCKACLDGMQAF